jgi:hypothetical protein
VKARERGTWRKGSLTGNLESYVRHVKEGFRNGASLSFQRLQYRNLERRFPHWGLQEKCNGRHGNSAFLL